MKYEIVQSKIRRAAKDYECIACQLKHVEPAECIINKGEKYQIVKCVAFRGIGLTYPTFHFHIGHAPKPETVLEMAEVLTRIQQHLTHKTEIQAQPQISIARRAYDAFREAHLF